MSNTKWIQPSGFHFFDMPDFTAIFVLCPHKTFVIEAEPDLGERFHKAETGQRCERPLTHELLSDLCTAVGAKVVGVSLTDVNPERGIFYAVISLEIRNELGEKFIELDARPSDALTLAFRAGAPVRVSEELLCKCEDAGELLKKLRAQTPQG